MDVKASLLKIGLKDKEIAVYLMLLERGRMKPSEIATILKINRATTYNILKVLVSRGIIAEDISGKTSFFTPLPPESLINLTRDIKREIEEKESLIREAVSGLQLLQSEHTYPVPKIRLIEESSLEKFLYDNTTKWQDAIIASDGIWWGFQDKKFAKKYQKWIDFTWTTEQSTHLNYVPKVFTNSSETELELAKKYARSGRSVKILEDIELTANIWVCGDYMVMMIVDQKPMYLIEIHDKMIAHNVKSVFKKLWKMT
jgi:sugar-specific transcriptional regulator TrmB